MATTEAKTKNTVKHTCTKHKAGSVTCYNQHHCRCARCNYARLKQDRRSRGNIEDHSTYIPVTEETRRLAENHLIALDMIEFREILGLDLPAEPRDISIQSVGKNWAV